jgi:hypothetical protein
VCFEKYNIRVPELFAQLTLACSRNVMGSLENVRTIVAIAECSNPNGFRSKHILCHGQAKMSVFKRRIYRFLRNGDLYITLSTSPCYQSVRINCH